MKKFFRLKVMFALALMLLVSASCAFAHPWKFGVISDTQWIGTDDGRNPNTCAVDIINQVNQQFINKGVKLVVAVGDLTDKSTSTAPAAMGTAPLGIAALDTRSEYAQRLYNAGIGFFPFRGNHEDSAVAAAEFLRVFPQTVTGLNNATPPDAFVATVDAANVPPDSKTGSTFTVGQHFSSPSANMAGLSYSFDYNNARFVLLDQFTPPYGPANSIANQQGWITSMLASRPAGTHAFVFSHKGLITENHVDNLFGANPAVNKAAQDAFIESLYNNGARILQLGHDHMHDRSIVTTSDGVSARVTQVVSASDSSKFYTPNIPSNDTTYDVPAYGHACQTPVSQELYTVGYYIYTVDGPRVTVDYYSTAPQNTRSDASWSGTELLIPSSSYLVFSKRESFGYSLNGKEFMVSEGQPYTDIQDSFSGTTGRILDGINENTDKDHSNRPFTKAVDTGWTPKTTETASDILTLWGMANEMGSDQTDTFALSMNYDSSVPPRHLGCGSFGLAVRDADGNWINAVDKNFGGSKKFVMGPWDASYGLGTYGIDPSTHTAWAVVNYNADFAVAQFSNAYTGNAQK